MKKVITLLVLVFAFALSTQGQKKKAQRASKLTIEQQTTLAVKKMTLALDLSEKQQNEIKPILMAKMTEHKMAVERRKADKEPKKRPSTDEIYAMKSKQLDGMILMKNKMKNILDKKQYEQFEKMQKRRMKMGMKKKKGHQKKKMMKKQKEIRENK
ncbi:hypothetical protein OAJ14_05075 [Polaribacter sp.]|nr:hypothetical protein [Polaribacter sp.]